MSASFTLFLFDLYVIILLYISILESETAWGMASGGFLFFRLGKNVFFPLFSPDLGPTWVGMLLLGFIVFWTVSLGGSSPFCESRTGRSSPRIRAGFTVRETVDYTTV